MPSPSAEVVRQFRRFDTNGDGVIERAELADVLRAIDPGAWESEESIDLLLSAVDRDHNGRIQMSEFVHLVFCDNEDHMDPYAFTPTTVCCASRHPLEALGTTRDNGWACDGRRSEGGCKGDVTKKARSYGKNRFRCQQCDFDLCESCFLAKLAQCNCKNGHPMTPLGLSRDNGRWFCDGRKEVGGCKSGITGPRQSVGVNRFRCDECDYDLCEKCYLARAGHATCGGGRHALVPLGTSADNGWFCDGRKFAGGCKSGIDASNSSAGINRYRCATCDYDLCEKCFLSRCELSAQRFKQFQDAVQLLSSEEDVGSAEQFMQGVRDLFRNAGEACEQEDYRHTNEVLEHLLQLMNPRVMETAPEACVLVSSLAFQFLPKLEDVVADDPEPNLARLCLEMVEKIGGMLRTVDKITHAQENFQYVLRVAGCARDAGVYGLLFELLDDSRQGTFLTEKGNHADTSNDGTLVGKHGAVWEALDSNEHVVVVRGTSAGAGGVALAESITLDTSTGRQIGFAPPGGGDLTGQPFEFEAGPGEQIVLVHFRSGSAVGIETVPIDGWTEEQQVESREAYNVACEQFCRALIAASRNLGPKEAKYALFQARQLDFQGDVPELEEMNQRVANAMSLPDDWDMSIMEAVDLGSGKGHQNLFGQKDVDGEALEVLQQLFDASFKKVYTRDRRGGGVPDRLVVERAVRIQNATNWMEYKRMQDDVREKLVELKTTGSPGLCKKGHALVPLGTSRDNGWHCDGRADPGGCLSGITGRGETRGMLRFRCTSCDYDLCEKCFLARTGQKLCHNGHRLAPLGTSREVDWLCDGRKNPDGCKSGITRKADSRGVNRYRCEVCDFDLCDKCYQMHMGNIHGADDVKTDGILRGLDLNLDETVNAQWLFHGTNEQAAACIVRGDFRVDKAGSNAGTLYGRGVYLAESCCKSDEYTLPNDAGQRCLLLCRATLGNVLYCDDVKPNVDRLVHMCVNGSYHSVLGDREKTRGTYREFIVYDENLVYPDFIIWYRRQYSDATPAAGR